MREFNKHIILIGFMGTGKTIVGIELAKHLAINYIDTDKEIEWKEGTSINEIFSTKGEEYFRRLETVVFSSVINSNSPSVISTGGGIVLSKKNRIAMCDSLVILLQASPEEIYARIKEDTDRPLLKNEINLLSQITNLLNQRQKLYKEASNYTIETGGKQISEIVAEIVKCINFKE